MTSLRRSWRAVTELGLTPLASYAAYRLSKAVGWLRWRTPAGGWNDWPLERLLVPGTPSDPASYASFRRGRSRPSFLLDPSTRLPRLLLPGERKTADDVLRGEFRLGGGGGLSLGFPPRDWSGDAAEPTPAERHWSQVDLALLRTDARLAWDVSRFGWVFPLAGAFHDTRERRYAEGFWDLWTSWKENHPPNRGLQWVSAQEVALRLLALAYAFHVLSPAWSRHPERLSDLAQGILVHALRIPPTITYARAQGNNHLLSEAAGLYTAGLLFPEARGAASWHAQGRSLFIEGVQQQILPDGGYVQHSANYHRLAIQLALWVARLAEANEEPLPGHVLDALGWSTLALGTMVDSETGQIARLGPDDGSDLLPVGGSRGDLRPTLQSASRLFLARSWLAAGPWDHAGAWLGIVPTRTRGGSRAARPSPLRAPAALPAAGLQRLEGRRTWGLLRAAHFTSRPGHSDQLHVDLWWRGTNIALDPGSYLYRAPAPWSGSLAEAACHNTLTVDGADPMDRAGPFLWLHWAQAGLLGRWTSDDGSIEVVTAQHAGYGRVLHRRTLARFGEADWWVIDDVLGSGTHRVSLGWNVPDARWSLRRSELRLRTKAGNVSLTVEGGGLSVYCAGERVGGSTLSESFPAWGWRSPGYGRIEPCLRIVATRDGELPTRLVSRWTLGAARRPPIGVQLRDLPSGPCPIVSVRLGRSTLSVGNG